MSRNGRERDIRIVRANIAFDDDSSLSVSSFLIKVQVWFSSFRHGQLAQSRAICSAFRSPNVDALCLAVEFTRTLFAMLAVCARDDRDGRQSHDERRG